MPRRGRLGATPHHLLISAPRADAVRDPRGIADAKTGTLGYRSRTILLISAPRADAVRPLEESQMPRREHLGATPRHFTDQRPEG
jgi:hypothetical protein